MILITRKNAKLGNYLHYNHQADARDGGPELLGYEQVQVGEEDGEPVFGNGDPIYGDPLYECDWDEAWGEPPTDESLEAWEEPEPEAVPVSEFEVAVQQNKAILAGREEQAKGDITELKSRVAVTLVATGAHMADDTLITADNVNAEGSRFVVWHAALISAYKDAGGNPEAGQALYNSIASAPSLAAFPWLTEPVLAIFSATLLVESPAP